MANNLAFNLAGGRISNYEMFFYEDYMEIYFVFTKNKEHFSYMDYPLRNGKLISNNYIVNKLNYSWIVTDGINISPIGSISLEIGNEKDVIAFIMDLKEYLNKTLEIQKIIKENLDNINENNLSI